MEHDAEARRGFARMGFGYVRAAACCCLLLAVRGVCSTAEAAAAAAAFVVVSLALALNQAEPVHCARAHRMQVQALPEALPDPRALLRRRLPLPPLPQRIHGADLLHPLLLLPYPAQ